MTTPRPGFPLSLRSLVLPLLALIVIASLPAPLEPVRDSSGPVTACGPVVRVRDPDIRKSFARFDRDQSAAARQICAVYVADTHAPS
jgi:hypothetical protein